MLVICDMPEHEWITDEEKALQLLDECLKAEVVAWDTETDTLDITKARAKIWSLAIPGRRVALPGNLLKMFEPLWDSEVARVAHNCKYDMHVVENTCGIRMTGPIYDTKVMAVLENTERGNYKLKFLAGDGLFSPSSPKYIKYESLFKGKVKTTTQALQVLGLDNVTNYASKDSYATLNIFNELKERLIAVPGLDKIGTLWDVYNDEELDFTHALYECERNGILLDTKYLEEKTEIAEKKLAELSEDFVFRARSPINMNSPKQLADFFYKKRNKPIAKMTAGGKTGIQQPSVDVHVLSAWAKEGDVFSRIILDYRTHKKVLSTYLNGLLAASDKEGRVHTTLNQGGTDTGRLSSRDPNLQNIPRPGDEGDEYRIREAFISPKGKLLVGADYDQLEMRIMAELAVEPKMIEMINKGWDVHAANASLMYEIPYEDIIGAGEEKKLIEEEAKSKKRSVTIPARLITLTGYRQDAKKVGFGLNYGQGPKALSMGLGCSVDEAKAKIARYFEPFPNIRKYIEDTHDFVKSTGYISTISGRRRQISEVFSGDFGKISQGERKATNTSIQGSAADIVRLAMIYCHRSEALRQLDCRMLLQIHDELVFEVPEANAEAAAVIVKELMELPYKKEFTVSITTSPKVGERWTDIH